MDTTLVPQCPSSSPEEATEGPQGGSGSPGPNLGQSPGQTPCEELAGWTQPSPRWVWRREQGDWGWDGGRRQQSPVSDTAFLAPPGRTKLPRFAGFSVRE